MFVLMRIESCATPTPKSAGSMSERTFRTSVSASDARIPRGRRTQPSLASAAIWTPNCKTPPIKTAAAKAQMGSSKYGVSKIVAPMKLKFSKIGVAAGIAKRFIVLRIDAASATRLMNAM